MTEAQLEVDRGGTERKGLTRRKDRGEYWSKALGSRERGAEVIQ